ncbi:lysozyme inhibitor LprI family protein [Chondrinema litorale]|uniref:lysozyme inhibitor LprI family protein n=1 Tax=Chondrinema litorale TaxID=2994555 RepID=UPI0025438C51|nr:lysozyme inhibitor LprI family protein [Chondrinema litorale]UZR94435.1 hypothetical protein OQ292_01210 [Chondrinema litorale]
MKIVYKHIFLIVFFFTTYNFCHAQNITGTEHQIDIEINECYDKNPSKLGIMECEIMGYQKWKTEVDRVFNLLLSKLDSESQLILKEQQRAWEALTKLQFELNEKLYSNQVSLLATITTDLMRRRAMELQSHLNVLQ